jgi:hypothetical protein
MNVLNKLIEDLLSRSAVQFSGAITVGLRKGGLQIKGEIPAAILDWERANNVKTLANVVVPVEATIEVAEVTFSVPGVK